MMSLDDWHIFFVSVCLFLVLITCSPLISAYMPKRGERFLTLALLGEEGMAELYYPENDPSIEVNEVVHWTLYLNNHMGETEYVAVRVKLINSTMSAPNNILCSPSSAPIIYEFQRVIMHNETCYFPLSWSIFKVKQNSNFLNVDSITINGDIIDTNVDALHGYFFRFVIELWTYDEMLGDFRFGWNNYDEEQCTWNQVWFNVTSIVYERAQ